MKPAILLFVFVVFIHARSGAQPIWKWAKTGTESGSGFIEPFMCITDAFDNVYGAGIYEGTSTNFGGGVVLNNPYPGPTYQQLFITKTDANGNFLWVLGNTGPNDPLMSPGNVYPTKMTTDAFGNLVVAGYYNTSSFAMGGVTVSNPAKAEMGYIMKIATNGTVQWIRNIGSGNNTATPNIVGTDALGNIYIAGNFDAPALPIGSTTLVTAGMGDIFVARYDPSGNAVWAKSYGNSDDNLTLSMTVSATGNIYICGYNYLQNPLTIGSTTLTATRAYLAMWNSSGVEQWARKISATANSPKHMALDVAGNVYLAGGNSSGFALSKFTAAGDSVWVRAVSGSGGAFAYSMSIDQCGNIWACGTMGGSVGLPNYSMNFPAATLSAPPGSYDPSFIACYDTAGVYRGAMTFISGGDDDNGISVNNKGDLYFIGDYFKHEMYFGGYTLPYTGLGEYLYLAKYQYLASLAGCPTVTNVGVEEVAVAQPAVRLFPNPTQGKISITSARPIGIVKIYSILGLQVLETTCSMNHASISLEHLPDGMYIVNLGGSNVYRVMKE